MVYVSNDNLRIKTGIAEFDKMLGGGFMQGDAVLVAGSAMRGAIPAPMRAKTGGSGTVSA